jgi:rubrerythrin
MFKRLDGMWKNAPEAVRKRRRRAIGYGHLAAAMLYDQAGDWSQSRKHMLQAIRANKKFLLELAAMEDQHEETFKAIRAELSAQEKASTVFDPNGEAALYLRALADTRVFYEKEIDVSSMKAILKSAITAEKDSIVFYLGMKEAVAESLGKGRLDHIIKEEMGHIKLLSSKLVQYKE